MKDIGITLEEALGKCHTLFKKKLIHSVELLRKAEKLALTYDKEDGFYLAFSGGKDSQALYHVVQLAGVKFRAHMNFTSVDPPQVIRFVRKQYPDVVTHAPQKSIYQLAVDRGILPSMRIRWCCADLKETAGAGKVTLIGIRKEESTRRAKRHEVEVSSKNFSGNLDEFSEWQKAEIEKKEAKLIRKMKRESKKVNEDEFSLTKDNEVRCINGKDSILISPIFEWTERDVWYFLNEVVKVSHCELYDKGYKRIGCILCPMSTHKQKVREMQMFPHVKRNWIKAIKAIRAGGYSKKNISGGTSEPMEDITQPTTGNSNTGITPPDSEPGTAKSNGTGYGSTLSDWQWKYHDGKRPPNPNGCRKSCSSGTGNVQSSTRGQSGNSSKSSNYPPSAERRMDSKNPNLQREYGLLQERKRQILRGHWNRKCNCGLWAGFRVAPL